MTNRLNQHAAGYYPPATGQQPPDGGDKEIRQTTLETITVGAVIQLLANGNKGAAAVMRLLLRSKGRKSENISAGLSPHTEEVLVAANDVAESDNFVRRYAEKELDNGCHFLGLLLAAELSGDQIEALYKNCKENLVYFQAFMALARGLHPSDKANKYLRTLADGGKPIEHFVSIADEMLEYVKTGDFPLAKVIEQHGKAHDEGKTIAGESGNAGGN